MFSPSFALYCLPHADSYVMMIQTKGNCRKMDTVRQISSEKGFVIAPFCVSEDNPLLLIEPDITQHFAVSEAIMPAVLAQCFASIADDDAIVAPSLVADRQTYADDFRRCHTYLYNGTFSKIVLARSATAFTDKHPFMLFIDACRRYPHMFVSLTFTPFSGMWLTATPEILLEGSGQQWHTIALAGTMRGDGSKWSDKNKQEQRYVAQYIYDCLTDITQHITEQGPYTVSAGNLVHLRSDFSFDMKPDLLGSLLESLHPTPAVCGLPKVSTYQYILTKESGERRYYSGFGGPVSPDEAHLYVSLRCMQIMNHRCILYAGGGILPDSNEEEEWLETEAKMDTMRSIL